MPPGFMAVLSPGGFGQRDIIQNARGRVADAAHDFPDGTGADIAAIRAGAIGGDAGTRDRRNGPVDDPDDFPDRDGLGRSTEKIAAFFAASAVDQLVPSQLQQNQVEKFLRDVLLLGNLVGLQQLVVFALAENY